MKDCRIPLGVAVPAAISVLGILWLLRRKSGPDDKGKATPKALQKDEKQMPRWNDKEQLEQRSLHVQKEGATISQRKIPENQARDRGSSDLEINELIGSVVNQACTSSEQLESTSNLDIEQSLCKAQTIARQCGQDGDMASLKKAHIEPLKPIVGDDLQEIDMDQVLLSLLSQSAIQRPSDKEISEHHAVNGQLLDSQDTLFYKTDSPKLETNVNTDHLQTLPDLTLKPAFSSSSNTQTHAENVQLNTEAGHIGNVRYNTDSVTPTPYVCDKLVECFDNSNNNKRDSDTALMTGGQEIVLPLQQAISASFLPSSSLSSSQNTEHVDFIEESCNTSKSVLVTEFHDHITVTTHLETDADIFCSPTRLPCDLDEASSSASLWMPTTSSTSNDILCPADVESIWSTESCTETDLTSLVNTFSSLDADSSLNLISSSCDPNRTQATSPATALFSESLNDAAYTSCCENSQTIDSAAESSKSTKDESPVMSSSPACDSNSEGSNDSGRGGSEHDVAYQVGEALVHFEFNMPSDLCGRFIGKHGKNINYLKNKTGAHVSLTNNMYTPDYQICQVVGNQTEVDDALAMIRRKFPLRDYPLLTMDPIDMPPAPVVIQPDHQLILPDVMQLSLPEGVSVDVFVSAIVDAGHLFVQQPTHRSFMSLEKLNYFLGLVYGQDPNVPCVPTPIESGIICVCENDGFWYRAMIMTSEDENGECQVKFVDYGGYAMLAVSSLKQIRADFMTLPFQAVECFMANVTPNQTEQFFSEEATVALSDMTRDKLLQCQVVARVENGIPYIHLYQISSESNSAVMINRALVNTRLVRWIEIL